MVKSKWEIAAKGKKLSEADMDKVAEEGAKKMLPLIKRLRERGVPEAEIKRRNKKAIDVIRDSYRRKRMRKDYRPNKENTDSILKEAMKKEPLYV